MHLRALLLCGCLSCFGLGINTVAEGQRSPQPLMLADFEEPDLLDRIRVTEGCTVSISDQDVVSGRRCLEVRVRPFSTHGNKWPYVFLIDKYFVTPFDLTRHSRVVASVRNVTEGLATVRMTLSSKPYNDGGRNLEGDGFVIPGGSTMRCSLPTSLFRRPMNDPSTVQALMFVFPPNETEAVYRIDAIQAVYDRAEGSPAEKLVAEAESLLKQVQGLEQRVNWEATPPERAAALRQRLPELTQAVQAMRRQSAVAATEGWKGTYGASRETVDRVGRSLGEFALADKQGCYLWQRPRYSYVRREALPSFASPALERIDIAMAGNEFRDASWMATAAHQDVELAVRVTSREPDLREAVQLRWSDFVQPAGSEEYADVLVPLEGTLKIPRGESRELWATFDTRWHQVRPGRHELQLRLHDVSSGGEWTVPISWTVWDFALPSPDVLPNNGYVEYHNSEIGTHVPDEGTRHMKMYGVNMVYVLPTELPWPVKLDEQGKIVTFETARLSKHVSQMLKAWQAAPGQERLRWIFALSGAPERLLVDKTIAYPSETWHQAFEQWIGRFRELVRTLGIADEDWMFVLADESSESALTTYEIPLAERIKRLDESIVLTCNASQVISDPVLAERFFRVFDILQPCLDSLKHSSHLREFMGINRRPLWTYRCQSMAGLDKHLYDYYRVYAWENLSYGISGTGIWTYCAQGDGAWSKTGRSLAYNLVFKQRDKTELIHSRRYEFYREGLDDYRYVQALLAASRAKGGKAEREARALVARAIADITADVSDVTRCERWRKLIADRILKLQVRQ